MNELLEYTQKESWVAYLTELQRKTPEEIISETPELTTNEIDIEGALSKMKIEEKSQIQNSAKKLSYATRTMP